MKNKGYRELIISYKFGTRPTDKVTADSRSVQSFAIIKNIGNVFTLELEINYPSETSLCTVAPSPQTPLLRFFLTEGGGRTQAIWNG